MRVKHWSRRSSPVAWLLQLSVLRHLGRTDVPRLQSVQNAAARLVTGTRRSSLHIRRCSVSYIDYWLPVRQSVDFKVATLVHRSLSGFSPSYLPNDRRLVAGVRERRLRSTNCRTCVVTWIHTVLSAIEELQLQDLDYGTIFHRTRKRQTCRTVDSGGR